MDVERTSSTAPAAPVVLELRASKNGRVVKAWKSTKSRTSSVNTSKSIRTPFEKRMEKEKARQAVKAVEQGMHDEEQAEKDAKVARIRERREKADEKKRLEAVAAKMSAKKLQRMKKRLGRSKKING